ncbi:MAG: response regulator, partial [Caldilinea sp.]|nr:response regulator [Caldilinea sp.]
LSLVSEVLDSDKIDNGVQAIDVANFNLGQFCDDVVATALPTINANGNKLVIECAMRDEMLSTDRTKAAQILINLLGNAGKLTKNGTVTLSLQIEKSIADDRLVATVSDTGIGIDPVKLSSIFDAFVQGDTSTTRQFGGTGLGLSISARLVHMMGGDIWAESALGQGSSFHFSMLLGIAQDLHSNGKNAMDTMQPIPDSTLRQAVPLPSLQGVRILLAEDNAVNQKLALRLLSKHGFDVAVVSTGQQALDALANDRFDLVLMDVQMPELDGLEATRRLRQRERDAGGHIPVIAMTAHAMMGDRERCLAAGMDGYVTKPIQIETLLATIGDSLPSTTAAP